MSAFSSQFSSNYYIQFFEIAEQLAPRELAEMPKAAHGGMMCLVDDSS
jgi:hypothetical protein